MSPKRSRREPRPPKRASPAPAPARSDAPEDAPDAAAASDESAAATFPIVGVGASAGGLEPIHELLGALGGDPGVAVVVVQHLSPRHESLSSQIFARATPLPVREGGQGTLVERNHVYVIPPDREMTVSGGRLRLTPREEGAQRHLPIDHFFRSLAEERGHGAIGIVLSGTGSDGTLGLQAIKTAGGITFAQDEASATHPEMPRAATAAGVVDVVLPPGRIAAELLRLRAHGYVARAPADVERVPEGEAAAFEHVLQIVRAVSGTDFSGYKPSTIRRRVARRMALARIERLEDYARVLRESRAEVDALYDDVLINVTSFFRDPAAFEALERRVVPAILRQREDGTRVRVWVPGCSTGEEAYSIAMILFEHLGDRASRAQVQVFGTDLSESVVERARAGRYPASIAADVSPERLRRFFVGAADGFQVSKPLRDACVFARHDLLRDPPFSRIDLVSCRNVLIYLGPRLQRKAVSLFHYALRPDGYLLLGTSEHIAPYTDLFTLVDKRHKIYVRRSIPSRLAFAPGVDDGPFVVAPEAPSARAEARAVDVQREADRVLMSRYVPAGVVVDDNMDILQFRGHTGPYLEPRSGHASLHLLKMAREGLVPELRSAFQRARREGATVRRERVRMKTDGGVVEVSIEVVPFTSRHAGGRLFVVLFDSTPSTGRARRRGAKAGKPSRAGKPATAEQELAATKEYLEAVIEEQEATNEELMSANEEILSSNEELQSTNEELETAKEELQSSIEELTTVNDELHARNAEVSDVNDDLANLLTAIQVPMAILDPDLRVRRATPAGERMLRHVVGEPGRRGGAEGYTTPELVDVVREVIDTAAPRRLDVRDPEGRWHAMQVRPYTTRARTIAGVVVTWTELGRLAERTDRGASAGAAPVLLAAIPSPAAFLDPSTLRVDASNDAWRGAFPPPAGDDPVSWGDPAFVEALRAVASGGPAIDGLRLETDGSAPPPRTHRVSLSRLVTADAAGPRVLVIVRDAGSDRAG